LLLDLPAIIEEQFNEKHDKAVPQHDGKHAARDAERMRIQPCGGVIGHNGEQSYRQCRQQDTQCDSYDVPVGKSLLERLGHPVIRISDKDAAGQIDKEIHPQSGRPSSFRGVYQRGKGLYEKQQGYGNQQDEKQNRFLFHGSFLCVYRMSSIHFKTRSVRSRLTMTS
jgi:hypothetical protein